MNQSVSQKLNIFFAALTCAMFTRPLQSAKGQVTSYSAAAFASFDLSTYYCHISFEPMSSVGVWIQNGKME